MQKNNIDIYMYVDIYIYSCNVLSWIHKVGKKCSSRPNAKWILV